MKINDWLKATAQRMARSAAAAMLSVGIIGDGFNALGGVDYKSLLGVGLGAALVSLLLCVAGQATSGNGPAFGTVEQVAPTPKGRHVKGQDGVVNIDVLLILTIVNTVILVILLVHGRLR